MNFHQVRVSGSKIRGCNPGKIRCSPDTLLILTGTLPTCVCFAKSTVFIPSVPCTVDPGSMGCIRSLHPHLKPPTSKVCSLRPCLPCHNGQPLSLAAGILPWRRHTQFLLLKLRGVRHQSMCSLPANTPPSKMLDHMGHIFTVILSTSVHL